MSKKKAADPIPVIFGWINTADGQPSVKKMPGQDVYSMSSMLLLHSKKHGSMPGYFVKYQNDHLAATPQRKKGDCTYHRADGTEITDVKYFFEIRDIPAPKEPAKAIPAPKEPAKAIPAPKEPAKAIPTPKKPAKAIPTPKKPAKAIPATKEPKEKKQA